MERASLLAVDPETMSLPLVLCGLFVLALIAAGVIVDIILLARLAARPPDWAERIRKLKSRPWSWRDATLVLLVLLSCYTGLLLLTSRGCIGGEGGTDSSMLALMIAQTIALHGAGAAAVLLVLRFRQVSWRDAFGQRGSFLRDVGRGLVYYAAAMPAVVLSALLYRQCLTYLGHEIEPQGVIGLLLDPGRSPWLKAYIAFFAVAVAPIVEEMLFRGVALSVTSKTVRPAIAVIAVSGLFAAIHFHTASLVPLFVIALAFSTAYIHSGSIVVPIVMHAAFNGVAVSIVLLLGDSPALGLLP
ncbi:MAG: CPBP family intramembrane metalloprotease [Lentisphaerae bacterium]|nr:CPBP family intramembrane metalloprotease [Lentisphaerota bacterium]